ncbi:Aldehyde/histidinol dehydrogenase, partial [Mycena pura]
CDPAKGYGFVLSASASSADCNAAVEAAGLAFTDKTPYARRDIFLKAASLLDTEEWRAHVVQTTVEETGCTPVWASLALSAAATIRIMASFANDLTGKTFMSATVPGMSCVMEQRAMGIWHCPWNAPFTLTIRAFGIPLICGSTVVIKSSEFNPRTQALAIQLFHE